MGEHSKLREMLCLKDLDRFTQLHYRVLKGPGVSKGFRGGTLGNPKDSVWEDWGTLGIREDQGNHHPP